MTSTYNHKEIEAKWQKKWRESGIYDVGERDSSKEKRYILVEWPYPSGNLHIGHWFAFAVVDIYVRYLRMQGKQVLFPIGFDAFGLPAENAAIQRKLNPRDWTESNIAFMKKQLESMGNAFTWNRTASSTDPDYYKWTQWMFTQFFQRDIAYRGKGVVNWCPSCNTVLANEQVTSDDTCERCKTAVVKKEMDEWKMRITKYADRLIDDLEKLDWPEHIKESQRNWIGRSKGAHIDFEVEESAHKIQVFTTRPDTLFGATYMVLAPEHPLLLALKEKIQNWYEVSNYVESAAKKTEMDRTAEGKEKTGVALQGLKAVNPATKESIPIFIADYVLAHYGTGAIMAVPAHDERDGAFAEKFKLPVREVIQSQTKCNDGPYTGEGVLINSDTFNGLESEVAKKKITEAVGGTFTNTYRLRDWSVGRQRYWGVPIPIVYDPNGVPHAVPEKHLPWVLPEDVDPTPTGEPPLQKSIELKKRTEEIFGEGWTPEVETMDTFVDSSWYFLRYVDNQNSNSFSSLEAQKSWLPVDIYFGGAEHTTMHLLYSRFWQKVLFDLGLVSSDEPYKKRINRGLVLGPDGNKMSKSKGNVIDPDEQVGRLGSDAVKMYLAFMGPYAEVANYPWTMGGIVGIRRFLEKVWRLSEKTKADSVLPQETTTQLHKTIKKVGEDIVHFKFNTAISQLMILVSHLEKLDVVPQDVYNTLLQLLAPFAPHLTEELWEKAGHTHSIHGEEWPSFDQENIVESSSTIVIQINGKVREEMVIESDLTEDEIATRAKALPNIAKYLTDRKIQKHIYVEGRLINFVLVGNRNP